LVGRPINDFTTLLLNLDLRLSLNGWPGFCRASPFFATLIETHRHVEKLPAHRLAQHP
jgi:hypothetical protein